MWSTRASGLDPIHYKYIAKAAKNHLQAVRLRDIVRRHDERADVEAGDIHGDHLASTCRSIGVTHEEFGVSAAG
jgi:hypothetical protein